MGTDASKGPLREGPPSAPGGLVGRVAIIFALVTAFALVGVGAFRVLAGPDGRSHAAAPGSPGSPATSPDGLHPSGRARDVVYDLRTKGTRPLPAISPRWDGWQLPGVSRREQDRVTSRRRGRVPAYDVPRSMAGGPSGSRRVPSDLPATVVPRRTKTSTRRSIWGRATSRRMGREWQARVDAHWQWVLHELR